MFLKDTLEIILQIIGQVATDDRWSMETECKFNEKYAFLTEEEKIKFLDILKEICDSDYYTYMALLTFILRKNKTDLIVDEIINLVLSDVFSLNELIAIEEQITYILFVNSKIQKKNEKITKILELIVAKICREMNFDEQYIPMTNRNRGCVVLMIKPLLGRKHSPTIRLVNLYNYLRKIGYNVIVLSSSTRNIQITKQFYWNNAYISNTLSEESQPFKINYFGVDVLGYHIEYNPRNIINDITTGINLVKEFNPEYIISIGGNNFLADLCEKITTVIHMGCTSNIPITTGKYIMRYFNDGKTYTPEIMNQLRDDQKIFECIYLDELKESEDKKKCLLDLPKTRFAVAIAGNRLDEEVDSDFEKMLLSVAEVEKEVLYVIIGQCKRLKEKYENSDYKNNFEFIGYTNTFQEIIGCCNLFLNPNRLGGGGGAVAAICENVPILTFDRCDVASTAGKEFICKDYNDMTEKLLRYISDQYYRERQKKYVKNRYYQLYSVDSEQNIIEFLKKVKNTVLEDEKNM